MRAVANDEKILIGGNRNAWSARQLQRMLASVDIGKPTETTSRPRVGRAASKSVKVLIRFSEEGLTMVLKIIPEIAESIEWVLRKAWILRPPGTRDCSHKVFVR